MTPPGASFPSTVTSTPSMMPIQIPDPSIRGQSFDQLMQNRGIRFLHYKAIPCPNLNTLDDNSHDPKCPFCETKGFVYYGQKEIVGVFQSNSLQQQYEQHGTWDIGSAIITFPSEYSDATQADFNKMDKLVIPDYEHRLWQLLEFNPTTNHRQKLRYPITTIDYMASITNNTLKVYVLNTDYRVTSGEIEWIINPTYNTATEHGEVISVSYYAHPVYTVDQSLRELRVTQQMVNGQKVARRLPQEILVKKDFLTRAADQVGE